MIIENDPSARMQLRSMGELVHPAACCVCGSGICEAGYIDLGVYYDYEGQMYLCKTCLYQAGETFGMYTPDEVKQLQELNRQLIESNTKLNEELEHARPIVSAIGRTFFPAVESGPIPNDFIGEKLPKGNGSSDSVTESTDDREPEVEEHASSERRSDTSGSESHNFTFQ